MVSAVYAVTASNGYCPSNDTTFTVHVLPGIVAKISAPEDSVCQGDSVQLTASGGIRYRWSTGNTTNKIWVKSAATYTVYVYGNGPQATCGDSATIHIKIIPHITATTNISTDTICPGRFTTLTATGSGGPVTYRWSNGEVSSTIIVSDSVTTIYTVTIYGLCDSLQKFITVNVIPLPVPVINGTPSKCKGVGDTLTVSSSVNPTKYVWSNGATTTTIITSGLDSSTTLYVTAYNSFGCPVKDSFKIAVKDPPAIKLNPPTIACSGSPVLLKAVPSGTGPFTYTWSPGGQTTDTITVSPDSVTSYVVIVSNGCVSSKSTVVTPDFPVLAACCDHVILLGDDTVIVAHGSGSKPYQWSPPVNCLNPPVCDSVQVGPSVTTTYTVTMTDTFGCQLERIITIVVDTRCFDFIVPNVFTPTNAGIVGLDNVFYIKTENMNAWSISIYDRWGKQMFTSTNPNEYWTGNAAGGGQAPAGVYYYFINAACEGTTYKKDGFVQLIR